MCTTFQCDLVTEWEKKIIVSVVSYQTRPSAARFRDTRALVKRILLFILRSRELIALF